jgi:hypothetical protein
MAAAASPAARLAATFKAAAANRDSVSSLMVAVVQELNVVRPPARPVATAVCRTSGRPRRPVIPIDRPMTRHPAVLTTSVAHGQCCGLCPTLPRERRPECPASERWANQLSTAKRSSAPATPKAPTRMAAVTRRPRCGRPVSCPPSNRRPQPRGPGAVTGKGRQPRPRAGCCETTDRPKTPERKTW